MSWAVTVVWWQSTRNKSKGQFHNVKMGNFAPMPSIHSIQRQKESHRLWNHLEGDFFYFSFFFFFFSSQTNQPITIAICLTLKSYNLLWMWGSWYCKMLTTDESGPERQQRTKRPFKHSARISWIIVYLLASEAATLLSRALVGLVKYQKTWVLFL